MKLHSQVPFDEPFHDVTTPFDHHHCIGEVGVEVEGIEFVERMRSAVSQPVCVDVDHADGNSAAGAGARTMLTSDDERRGRHPALHPEPGADSARQRGLACPEWTVQHHQVAGNKSRRQASAESLGILGRFQRDLSGYGKSRGVLSRHRTALLPALAAPTCRLRPSRSPGTRAAPDGRPRELARVRIRGDRRRDAWS